MELFQLHETRECCSQNTLAQGLVSTGTSQDPSGGLNFHPCVQPGQIPRAKAIKAALEAHSFPFRLHTQLDSSRSIPVPPFPPGADSKGSFLGQHLELGGHMKAGTCWSHRVPTSGEPLSPRSEPWKSFYPAKSAGISLGNEGYLQELSRFSVFPWISKSVEQKS